MQTRDVPEFLQESDPMEARITELAVRLYRGQGGGAAELGRAIVEQAKLTAQRRAAAARQRAAEAA